ncbi:FAD-dependent monooxygenase [Pseudomonas sp. dw_358]|uniref:FAD-dependent monooxygenase n=1 Tax=Pseudomonas sp. dw_358 TaxID=2720083 RepID=UPI001BD6953F|nr:FAD-dependent monooxygenase [Pseudomonas sp. dw_358]
MDSTLRVGIIGAGIGGVTLARALAQQGIEAHVFERAAAFGEVGAGVQMTPNAVKVLGALGLDEQLDKIGFLPNAMVGRNWKTARELFRTPLKASCPELYGADFHHVHRADLHAVLASDIQPGQVTFGAQCVGLRQQANSAVALFADGSEFEADLIVGADGVRSVIREQLWGEEAAHYTGHMCWRALVKVDQHPLPFVSPDSNFWMGPKGHVVTYYVKGGAMVNIVAVNESPAWVEESWNAKSTQQALLDGFKGWHPDLIELFRRADPDAIYKWGLFDRDPMKAWSKGNATLLGDAGHPMLPFLSQGAAMAIEDGYVLARSLAFHGKHQLALALQAYELERVQRTSRVQLEARERGRTYHLPSAWSQLKRDMTYRWRQWLNPNAVGIQANWVYEYDARKCGQRFPLAQQMSA